MKNAYICKDILMQFLLLFYCPVCSEEKLSTNEKIIWRKSIKIKTLYLMIISLSKSTALLILS